MVAQNVLGIKEELLKEEKYFYGPQEVLRIYQQRYAHDEIPSLDFIKRICRFKGLVDKTRQRQKGCSAYQHYPAYTIANISDSMSELDFVGEKNISGRTEPIVFISYNSLKPFRFREYDVVSSQTSREALMFLDDLWERIPSPDILKVDNDLAFIGSASGKRSLSRFVLFLLDRNVRPLFINPRSPWNNGSIEGGNSVFGRKFWNKYSFTSVEDIRTKLIGFNKACNEYLGFSNDIAVKKKPGKAKQVYFVRKVIEDNGNGFIDVLNEHIVLPEEYTNQFIFAEWNLEKQILSIQYENDQKLSLVRELDFKINSKLGWSLSYAP